MGCAIIPGAEASSTCGQRSAPISHQNRKAARAKTDDEIAKTTGDPVRQTLDGGTSCLGLLHQLDDPGKSRLRTHPLHLHGQRCLEIQAAGGELRARFRLQRQRFAGEAGHVHCRVALHHNAIDRHPVPRQQLHPFTGAQGPDTHLADGAIVQQQPGRFRLKLRQLLQRLTGAVAGTLLKEATQQHEAQQHHRLIEEAGPAHLRPEQSHEAGQIGTADPQTHKGVHAWGSGTGRQHATDQDGAPRPDQGNRRQGGMERQAADHRQRESAGLTQVAEHREKQQQQEPPSAAATDATSSDLQSRQNQAFQEAG